MSNTGVGAAPYDLAVNAGAGGSDPVIVVLGDRAIRLSGIMELLERQRAVANAAGGGELLIRFFDDKPETIALPYPPTNVALFGMSYLSDARMVVSILHDPSRSGGGVFTAIAAFPSGSGIVVSGRNDGPLTVVDGGFERLPLMHLVMTNIASGRPTLAGEPLAVADWLLRTAFARVARAVLSGASAPTPELADAALRDYLSSKIIALRNAAVAPVGLRAVDADWSTLFDAAPFVANLDWRDLDDSRFAIAQGRSADEGSWWTARGLAGLDLIGLPSGDACLARLESQTPKVASGLRKSLNDYAGRLTSACQRATGGWHFEDPEQLVRLIRKVLSDSDFNFGIAVLGYRRDGMRLRPTARFDSKADDEEGCSLHLTALDSVGDADGILLIVNSGAQWSASVLNREGEHGTFTSTSGIDTQPVPEGELLASLRRLLVGHAQADPRCTPHDWLCRRILYGLARTLESGQLDGEDTAPAAEGTAPTASESAESAGGQSLFEALIDISLAALIHRHLGVLIDALRSSPTLVALPDEPSHPEGRLQTYADMIRLLRLLGWRDFDSEMLARGWNVPLEEARWWRADGLAYRQTFRVPEITESLMRCCFVIARAPDPPAEQKHLLERAKHLFGEDITVLWSFLPELLAAPR